ncbi:CPBP family intramembrane metalloprotease [Flavobacterium sp. SM15]|uniref:CPBP family intramembrane glutamic endopeptidase n=1 Tax=Flavobacterium sp. SM15 TaxID=2908005 RepID=UPI001EDB29FF|nr:CPBP family intramembrane glutamic endopeptidase [Flavobacterium sp. SM15]MCG2611476.1 CPBP family intramembrane metalloprotease [Flavobacterium sp. SM15]
MFIEQIKKKNFNSILYLPILLGFFGLMIVNYFSTQDVNTEDLMHQMKIQFGENLMFVILVGPLSLMCLGLLFWVKFIHNQSITSLTTSRKEIDWGRILFSFSLWGTITAIMTLAVYFAEPEDFVVNFDTSKFFVFLILAIILVPLQTSFEEYFFRGYLMQFLGVLSNTRLIPFVVSSVLFGLMHIANPEVGKLGHVILIYYIGTGFFLGILTLMDEGLELALGFHAANNLVTALLVTADWTAFQTPSVLKDISEPSAGLDVIIPVFVIFPILLFVFAKKYNWNNWQERLFGKLIKEEVINTNEA